MTQTFEIDITDETFTELKYIFRVQTNAQVIRKALVLARVVARLADKNTRTIKINSMTVSLEE